MCCASCLVSGHILLSNIFPSLFHDWSVFFFLSSQAVRYIELLPPEKRPVAGTEGAAYRRQQMARQLPEHDQDPDKCHELSPAEVKKMQQFVRKYKDEALGVGDVRLPEEMVLLQAAETGQGEPGGAGGAKAAGPGAVGLKGAAGAGGAVGTAAAAGAMAAPGATQQSFVRTFPFMFLFIHIYLLRNIAQQRHVRGC